MLLVVGDDVVGGVVEVLDSEDDDEGKVAEEETELEVEDVESVAEVVELEDIVNCLNLRSLGRLKPGSTFAEQRTAGLGGKGKGER